MLTVACVCAGDTSLQLAYNVAVILSMLLGFLSESLATTDRARRGFVLVWGACQALRGLGMGLLAPERLWLVFVFVFADKFSGPLGQASIDTALLKLISRGSAGSDSKGIVPANGLWTYRSAVSSLERPMCQLLLLKLQVVNAPIWLPMLLAAAACGFVWGTLRRSAEGKARRE